MRKESRKIFTSEGTIFSSQLRDSTRFKIFCDVAVEVTDVIFQILIVAITPRSIPEEIHLKLSIFSISSFVHLVVNLTSVYINVIFSRLHTNSTTVVLPTR
jgi:hypothetical protein